MIENIESKSTIVVIFNKYKDTFDNLIDSLNEMSLDWLKLIDKGLCNLPRSKSNSINLSKKIVT